MTLEQRLKARARVKAWRLQNPERLKAYAEANRSRMLATQRAYNKKRRLNPAHVAELKKRHKLYNDAHKEQRHAYMLRYYEENKDACLRNSKLQWSKRRALKQAATVNLAGIKAFIAGVKSKPFATCYYCGARVSTTKSRALHFDHIVALSQGGAHSVENLCVACETCNCTKHARPLSEWLKQIRGQQLLHL